MRHLCRRRRHRNPILDALIVPPRRPFAACADRPGHQDQPQHPRDLHGQRSIASSPRGRSCRMPNGAPVSMPLPPRRATFSFRLGQPAARGCPTDIYVRLGAIAARKGAKLVLDTSGEALRAAVEAGGIHLLKPSIGEFETLVGRKLPTPEEQHAAARELVASGARGVARRHAGPSRRLPRGGRRHHPSAGDAGRSAFDGGGRRQLRSGQWCSRWPAA